MRTIYKHHLDIVDHQVIRLAYNKIVHVGLDPSGEPCMWAELDTADTQYDIDVYIIGTGNPIPGMAIEHIGSFVQGQFVWHVYL